MKMKLFLAMGSITFALLCVAAVAALLALFN